MGNHKGQQFSNKLLYMQKNTAGRQEKVLLNKQQ